MKLLVTILLLFLSLSLQSVAQATVRADAYIKMNGLEKGKSKGVSVDSTSWADYAINIPVSGLYDFVFTIKNPTNISNIIVKTPTGKTVLRNVEIPNSPTWRYVRTKISLRAGTKKLRLMFSRKMYFEAFSYTKTRDTLEKSHPKFVTKDEFDEWVKAMNEKYIKFNKRDFYIDEDSTISLIRTDTSASSTTDTLQ